MKHSEPGVAVSVEDVLDAIESDVAASREDVIQRAAAMVTGVNHELTRLMLLEDCVATLKSANDSAIELLQHAAAQAILAASDDAEDVSKTEGRRQWR